MFVFVFPSASVPTLPTSIFLYLSFFFFPFSSFGFPFCFLSAPVSITRTPVLVTLTWHPANPPTPALVPLRFPKRHTRIFFKKWDSQGKNSVAWWSTLVVKPAGSNKTSPLSFFACCAKALRPVVSSTLSGAVDLPLFSFHYIYIYIYIYLNKLRWDRNVIKDIKAHIDDLGFISSELVFTPFIFKDVHGEIKARNKRINKDRYNQICVRSCVE